MKKALCVIAAILITSNFAAAQTGETVDLGLWYGLHNTFGMDPYYNFNSAGYGGRSMAMGGVYYAMGNEGYGSFLNPAGMVYTDKALLSADLFVGMDKHKGAPFYIATGGFFDPETDIAISLERSEIDMAHNRIDQAGAVTPFYYFDREWWFGGGFRTVYDLHSEFTMPYFIEGHQTEFTQHRSIDAINMAIATKPMQNLSIGINMNIYVRGYEQDLEAVDPIYDGDTGDTLFQYAAVTKDKSSFTGTNFDFGCIADFDMIRAGFMISTPLTLTQKVTYKRGNLDAYGDPYYNIDRITAKNKFPFTFGGGIALIPMENFTVGFDLTYKQLSKFKTDVDFEQNLYTDYTDYNPKWEDLTQIRLGAEYVIDMNSFKIPLRAGLYNIPGVYKNQTFTAVWDSIGSARGLYDVRRDSTDSGDQYNTYIYTFGTGLKFNRIWFDVAYQFGSSEYDQDWFIRIEDPNIDYTRNFKINYDYSRFYISVNMLF
jgi:hypothetical protein